MRAAIRDGSLEPRKLTVKSVDDALTDIVQAKADLDISIDLARLDKQKFRASC